MSPTTPKSGKKPSPGDTLALHSVRKTASCEPLGKDAAASSDEDSNRGGGKSFSSVVRNIIAEHALFKVAEANVA